MVCRPLSGVHWWFPVFPPACYFDLGTGTHAPPVRVPPPKSHLGIPGPREARTDWGCPLPLCLTCAPVCDQPQWSSALEDDIKQVGSSLLSLYHCAGPSTSSTCNQHRDLSPEQDQWTDQWCQGDQPVLEYSQRLWHCLRWSHQATPRLSIRLRPRRSSSHVRMFAQAWLHPPPARLRQHRPLLPCRQIRPHAPWGSLQRHLLPVSLSRIPLLSIESPSVFPERVENWYSAGMQGPTWPSLKRRRSRLLGNKSALGTCSEGSRPMALSLMSRGTDQDLGRSFLGQKLCDKL